MQSLWDNMHQREAAAPGAGAGGPEEEQLPTTFMDLWEYTAAGLFDDDPDAAANIPQLVQAQVRLRSQPEARQRLLPPLLSTAVATCWQTPCCCCCCCT